MACFHTTGKFPVYQYVIIFELLFSLTIHHAEPLDTSHWFKKTGEMLHPMITEDGLLEYESSQGECSVYCASSTDCKQYYYNPTHRKCMLIRRGQNPVPDNSYSDTQENIFHGFAKSDGDGNVPEVYDDWCPVEDGYEMLSEDGPCIKFFYPVVLWEEANRTCASLAPYTRLLVLDTEKKNTLLKAAGMAINNQFQTGIALGLSDHGGDGYKWVDGTVMSYSDWGMEASNDELHCVYLQRWLNWRWRAHACTNTAHYICEAVRELI